MLSKLKGGSAQLSLNAREYALDLGQAQWKPDIVTHVPGQTRNQRSKLVEDIHIRRCLSETPSKPQEADRGR